MTYNPHASEYWNEEAFRKELLRVFEICETCRRCYHLCPSFKILLDGLDEVEGDVEQLQDAIIDDVVDYCYQCKLCYPHCPYIPPHRWAIDFPRLMLRAKALRHKKTGVPLHDKILGATEVTGRIGTLFAPLSNLFQKNALNRIVMEKITGIARERLLPPFNRQTFEKWWKKHAQTYTVEDPIDQVVFFHTCFVNYQDLGLGTTIVKLLKSIGVEPIVPKQNCCGMPYFDGGAVDRTLELARKNIDTLFPYAEKGHFIVTPGPTCTYMLRFEYPTLFPDDERATKVSEQVRDIMEYLDFLIQEKKWTPEWPDVNMNVFYHIPCHLKVQNIGFRTLNILENIPGLTITVGERCTGMDGTWGLKARFFEESLKIAQPLAEEIKKTQPDVVVTDCPLAGVQIEQTTGYKPVHPILFLTHLLQQKEEHS